MNLATTVRRISDDQRVQLTWTDKAGNDYTVYDGDAETLKRRIPDFGDLHVLEMNCTDGVLLRRGDRVRTAPDTACAET